MGYDSYAYEIVTDSYKDQGFVPSLKQGRETDRTVRYAPWIVNYALQTDEEAASGVKGGEGFQQISDIAISPVDNNLMILGTDTCGIWRSEDGGANWLSVNNGVNCYGVHDIIFHPTDRNIAYMIQGGANNSQSTSQIQARADLYGFYKSEDGGKSWKQLINIHIRSSLSTNRLMAFDENLNLYLLSSEALLKLNDAGEIQEELYKFIVDDPINNSPVNYDLCVAGDTIVFTNKNGVYVSLDGGTNWEIRNIELNENVQAYGIDIDPEDPQHFLACFGYPYYEVYETFDSGETWNIRPVGANISTESGKHPSKIMFGKRNQDGVRRIYMLFSRVYTPLRVSTDEGVTWKEASYTTPWGENYRPLYGNAISLENDEADTVFLGTGTVMKSTDGGNTFTARNTPGFSGAYVEEIRFSDSEKLYLSVTDVGFYKSNDVYDGTSYPTFQHKRDQDYSTVGDIGIDPADENHIIFAECASKNYTLRESYDGGQSWKAIDGTQASGAPQVIKFHNENSYIIYSTYFTSRDGGATWNANEKNIYAVSEVNNDIVYGRGGKTLYKSSDCGLNFDQVYTFDWDITYILPDNTYDNIVYIGLKNGNIVKMKNDQPTLMDTENGLDNVAVYAMAQNPQNPQHIVIGGQCVDYSKNNEKCYVNYLKTPGIYETYDGGNSWHIVKGMPSTRVVKALAFSPSTSEIFVGGFTGGLLIYDYEIYNQYLSEENEIGDSFSVVYNANDKTVTVSGTIDKSSSNSIFSTILVLPTSVMPSRAQASDIVYLNQINTDADGSFEYSFKMPKESKYGIYDVYIGGSGIVVPGTGRFDSAKFDVVSFSFGDTDDITATAKVINPTGQSQNAVVVIAQYAECGDELSLIKMDMSTNRTINPYTYKEVNISASSNIQEQTKIYRAFIWDSMKNMRPLTGFIENVVDESNL